MGQKALLVHQPIAPHDAKKEELDLSFMFSEETRFPIRHRLHRYVTKYSQHTIQNDKTLVAIGPAPSESMCLLRKIYAALAEAEGIMVEVENTDDAALLTTASTISE